MQAVDFVPLGAIADAELQAEIDPEPDEQHGEVNRDQVERADQQHAERRRDRRGRRPGLTNTAKMIRHQRNASHRMNSTTAIVIAALSAAFSLMVANSSSFIGTGPVRRTRA